MARRGTGRRKRRGGVGKAVLLLVAVPLAYLLAALIGSLVPVNRGWAEPEQGTLVYLRSNGIHVDILMPAEANGLDWRPLIPASDFADAPADARWFAFGAGERRVYLDTPTWSDLRPGTIWAALSGGDQVLHVERTASPGVELRALRLRPQEYRRLWAAIRAEFDGAPQLIDHPGYGLDDAFYEGRGKASAVHTCNNWAADKLRLAGVRTSLWSPFAITSTSEQVGDGSVARASAGVSGAAAAMRAAAVRVITCLVIVFSLDWLVRARAHPASPRTAARPGCRSGL